MFHDDHFHCRKGKEFSKKCENDSECFSGSCHEELKECWCPTPGKCDGCNNVEVPCLRVEHQSSQPLEICRLKARMTKKGKTLDLFDAGAAHSDSYTNLDKVLKASSNDFLSIVPFYEGSKVDLPPAFVQASVLTEDAQNIGWVDVKGFRSSLLGLQIFVDNHWITNIRKTDLLEKKSKQSKSRNRFLLSKEKEELVEIGMDVYPRVFIDSFYQLRNPTFMNDLKGKTVIVPVPGRADLDFNLPSDMGIEFIGEGPEQSKISIVGNLHSMGRTNFKNLSVSFERGSLNIAGPLIFQSSQVLDINRCPPFFVEYNGLCLMVSQGIEQADDAHAFCEVYESSLANVDDVIPFLRDDKGSFGKNSFAWIKPVASGCSSVDATGVTYHAVEQECGRYLRVLCSTSVREPILGVKYTSYNSDQYVGTYTQDYFKRAVDKERLPFQLGGTLSFVQNDLFGDDDKNPVLFKAPDAIPAGVSVNFSLHSGDSSSVEIALDTFNSTGRAGYEWSIDRDGVLASLPTKIQLHTSDSVCVEKVELLVHNETGHSFVVARFPAKLVAECLDYNVCSEDDERLCGRSLMYYDKANNCARLEKDNSVIPRDLSIDLLALQCARLTTWNHPHLGAPFLIEAQVDGVSNPFQVTEFFGESHQYSFDGKSNKLAYELDESNVLPVDFRVEGSGLLRAVQITRYGLNVSGVDFSLLWDCINVCESIADPATLHFGQQMVVGATLHFIAANECQKLVQVLTMSGNGREICMSPPISVQSIAQVVDEVAAIVSSSTTYKTLNINVTSRLVDMGVIKVPTNRGLILYQDIGVPGERGTIENATVHVADLAEFFLVDLKVNGTTRILCDKLAKVEISGTIISVDFSEPFLTNLGETVITSVALYSNTSIHNVGNGRIEQMYVEFHDRSAFVNSENGTIQLSRLRLYEEFSSIDSNSFVGSLELPDAKRYYSTFDDEDDQECFGEDIPDITLSDVGTKECQQACEDKFQCSGVISYFIEGSPQCGLCLREDACSFDCSKYAGGAYFKAVSKFHFSKISACPYISRPFKVITDATLEECKLYCSYHKSCEGFRIIAENTETSVSKSCELIGDLDFAEECGQEDAGEVYIPFVPRSTNGFHIIYGNLTAPSPMAEHAGVPIDQCSSVCDKTISCSSFQVSHDTCFLYRDNSYIHTNEHTGLYISIDDPFPLKRYMGYQSCYLPGSYRTFNTKTLKRCQDFCNVDYSCVGFSFRPIRSLSEDNCLLYDSAEMINGVFGPNLGCQKQPLRREPRESLLRNLKGNKRKSAKSDGPSFGPSLEPSIKPTFSSSPSTEPSNEPSLSNAPSLVPSSHPSLSPAPSISPSLLPSSLPSLSNVPSMNPSSSIRPSQESETYDLFVAFSTETYTVSTDRAFGIVRNVTDLVEDECKALCFYDSKCLAIRYNISSSTCEIGALSEGSSIDDPFYALASLPADETSRYASSNACYVGERLDYDHEKEVSITEIASGYFHMPRTCTISQTLADASSMMSPAECGLQCSDDPSCTGFIYYVNHGGPLNMGKFGRCEKVTSFDLGTCDAVTENVDLYLRADIGATCQAACNVHQLCSSYIFDKNFCELYSDITLFSVGDSDIALCPNGEGPQRVQIGLSYRSRDGMVEVRDQCFVDYEDLRSMGCRDFAQINEDGSFEGTSTTTMTPWECQQKCKDDEKEIYAIHDGNRCSCGSEKEFLSLPLTSSSCTSLCDGDESQYCGGMGFASIGETGLPSLDLTLAECKRECFFSEFCDAIQFDSSPASRTRCQLRSIGHFESCGNTTSQILYIESLEHYYERPSTSYIGSESIHNTTTELKQDCQKLCDAFHSCEAINYTETSSVLRNCELLGGTIVPLLKDGIAEGVQVARDVTLYTMGFSPFKDQELAKFSSTFDLDECRTLCDQHILCGSIVFTSPTCTLYRKSGFADVNKTKSNASNHYIDYSYFVDPGQEFAYAKKLCVHDGAIPISSRKTTLSYHDCGRLCNSVSSCSLFTYNKNLQVCVLYNDDAALTSCSPTVTETYTMFTRSKFVKKPDACLKDEIEEGTVNDNLEPSSFMFPLKSPYECAALCDKWFNCRSFRSDEISGSCRLFRSEQYSIASCSSLQSAPVGELYVYYSDFRFTRLDNNFCVGGSAITSIDDLPIEACKSICDKSIDCLSFQHTQIGLCVLYSSADFSGKCADDDERDLYITYKDIVDPKSRFLFNKLNSCFDLDGDDDAVELSEAACKEMCESLDKCFGIQVKNEITSIMKCTILDGGSLPKAAICDVETQAFLRTKVNPYKKLEKTCLQKRIQFGKDGNASIPILDKEEYECMALCSIHPYCRYFLYGNSTTTISPAPQLRECILFEAQAIEVDECDNNDLNFINDYTGLTAYVNGRTFIDQITWFGEPEKNFANIAGLSYQECASLCDTLGDSCDAFVHTWNYRRRALVGSGRPLLFTNTRLMRLDFDSNADHQALFLMFDLNTSQLMLRGAISDDDVTKQLVTPEVTGQGIFKLKFWSSSGKCLSGKDFVELEDVFTRKVIKDNFEMGYPACQKFKISDCSDSDVIKLDDFSNARLGEVIKLTYKDSKGCVSLHRQKFADDIDLFNNKTGTLNIPPILLNNPTPEESEEITWCISSQTPCENVTIGAKTCTNNTSPAEDSGHYTTIETCEQTTESCVVVPQSKQPSASPVPSVSAQPSEKPTTSSAPSPASTLSSMPSDIPSIGPSDSPSVLLKNCTYTTKKNKTTFSYLQKTSKDLLQEIYSFFGDKCHGSDSDGIKLLSSTYSGKGCDFREDVASFPSQEFTWASDAVILQNNRLGRCLSGLTLIACDSVASMQWVYVFTSGHLYYADESNNMICLTRHTSDASLVIESCDKDNLQQRWQYNADSEAILAVDESTSVDKCLVVHELSNTVALGDCTEESSKWSRFEECRLNTRDSTSAIKVEKIGEPGQCIDIGVSSNAVLKSCNDAKSWKYYYDGNAARLELEGAGQDSQCLGRRAENYEIVEDESKLGVDVLKALPTGLVPCSQDKVVAYWRNTIAGKENNVFQWSLINVTTGLAVNPSYCVDVPQSAQIECPTKLTSDVSSWRRYGDTGDATEISVKPKATLQDISDPEVLFQFYLFTAEGKASRIVRSRMAALIRDVERLQKLISNVLKITSEAVNLVEMVQPPIDKVNDMLEKGESAFNKFKSILTPLQRIPYVGPVFKAANIPIKGVAKALKVRSQCRSLKVTS